MQDRIWDCFTFFNELDLLEIRLHELGDLVDKFVIVEGTRTFQGVPKPLIFQENRERFAAWANKIVHVPIDFPDRLPILRTDRESYWHREFYQRNQIMRGLRHAAPDDLVIISDVDEIPDASVLHRAISNLGASEALSVVMPVYQHCLNLADPDRRFWEGPKVVRRKHMSSPEQIRHLKSKPRPSLSMFGLGSVGLRLRNYRFAGIGVPVTRVEDGGWHFTSIGGLDAYRLKIDAYCHPEYRDTPEYRDAGAFEKSLLRLEPTALEKMPKFVVRNSNRFADVLWPQSGNSSGDVHVRKAG